MNNKYLGIIMAAQELLHSYLSQECPLVHNYRLNAIMDVAYGLQQSKNLSLTAMGRKINTQTNVKNKIKKVDRLEGNKHLHNELEYLYSGLSKYVFTYLSHNTTDSMPIIIDLCFIKDRYDIQMLSAEVACKGRSIPLYREVFAKGDLKNRAKQFLFNLSKCVPSSAKILVIMDAGFGEKWFKEIENNNWYWLSRIRQGKSIKLSKSDNWISAKDVFANIGVRAKSYNDASIMVTHDRKCRIITKKSSSINTRKRPLKVIASKYNYGNGAFSRAAKEPWILATNLPTKYDATSIVIYYKKRMQIEESFRDLKSTQFGLGARHVRTNCISRWAVKLLLAAVVQIIFWIIGIIGHSKDFQRKFQANTVRNKKVFSYFYLGQLIIEHDMVKELDIKFNEVPQIINQELARQW